MKTSRRADQTRTMRQALRRALRPMPPALIATCLAACDGIPDHAHTAFTDPSKRHPIVVGTGRATLDIPLGPEGRQLSVGHYDLRAFVRGYHEGGRGPLAIVVPRGPGAGGHRHAIGRLLEQEGVAPERVRWQHSSPDNLAIHLSYEHMTVAAPHCEDWSQDVGRSPGKVPYPNYGCATQRNIAHMVANPADLVEAAPTTPRGSDRRAIPRRVFVETPPPPAKLEQK